MKKLMLSAMVLTIAMTLGACGHHRRFPGGFAPLPPPAPPMPTPTPAPRAPS